MNTYAQIVDDRIVNVVVANVDWIAAQPGNWGEYDDARPAEIGWFWDAEARRAYPPQPYPSWTLDDNFVWQPPVPYPDQGGPYQWDEETQTWITPNQ